MKKWGKQSEDRTKTLELWSWRITVHVLVADIGGTNLRLTEVGEDNSLRIYSDSVDNCQSLQTFLEEGMRHLGVGQHFVLIIGAAGRVVNGWCKLTKNDIVIDQEKLRSHFETKDIYVLNDLELAGHYCAMRAGYLERDTQEISLAIASGTGLGLSIVVNHEGGFSVLPTEYEHSTGNHYTKYLHGRGILKLYGELVEDPRYTSAEEIVENSRMRRRPGDPGANRTIERFTELMLDCLTDVLYQYLPERVFLGGTMFKLFYPLVDSKSIEQRIQRRRVQLELPEFTLLPEDAQYIGGKFFAEKVLNLRPGAARK